MIPLGWLLFIFLAVVVYAVLTFNRFIGLRQRLANALAGVFVLVEDNPALKADTNFLELHRGLVDIEDDLQNARRYHNAVVRDLNTLCQKFPSTLVARAAGIVEGTYFQLDDDQRAVPTIDLGPTNPPQGE